MDTNKLGVVDWLDKYEVACGDEYVLAWLYESVLAYLDNNDKDDFDVDFLHAHSLGYILEETLGGKCLVHNGYMQKNFWFYTYFHFCYHHNYKN